MKRTILVKVLVFLMLLATIFIGRHLFITVGWDGLTTRVERQHWRDKVLAIYEELQLNMSTDRVKQVLDNHGWPTNLIDITQSDIRIATPLELGAQNWIVYLTFKNGLLSQAKVRMEDSIDIKPKDAPPDKGVEKGGGILMLMQQARSRGLMID
jgi:hypothetical protein